MLMNVPPKSGSVSLWIYSKSRVFAQKFGRPCLNLFGIGLLLLSRFADAAPIVPMSAWKLSNYSGVQFSDGTSDDNTVCANGLPNLLCYAFNLSPNQDASAVLPTISLQDGYLTATYTIVPSALDLQYGVEACTDLAAQDWDDEGLMLISSTLNIDGTETLVVQDAEPSNSFGNRFMRVRVDRIFNSTNSYGVPDDYLLATYGSADETYAELASNTFDANGNGLPVWWEILYFGTTGIDSSGASAYAGMTILQAYQAGLNPAINAAGAPIGGAAPVPIWDTTNNNPKPPVGLTVVPQNVQQVNGNITIDNALSWTNVATDAIGIVVERRPAIGPDYVSGNISDQGDSSASIRSEGFSPRAESGWSLVTTLDASATQYTDTVTIAQPGDGGVPAATVHFVPQIYWYRVRAKKNVFGNRTVYGSSEPAASEGARLGISVISSYKQDGSEGEYTYVSTISGLQGVGSADITLSPSNPGALPQTTPWGSDSSLLDFQYSVPLLSNIGQVFTTSTAINGYRVEYSVYSNTPYHFDAGTNTATGDPYTWTSTGTLAVLPVRIRVFTQNGSGVKTEAPQTGLVALASNLLIFQACDATGTVSQLPDDKVVWKTKKLLTGGNPDTNLQDPTIWSDWAWTGVGNTLSYYPTGGGIYLVKAELYGGSLVPGGFDLIFRARTENSFSDPRTTDKGGDPECIGLCDAQWQVDLVNQARGWVGSTNYSFSAPFLPALANQNKCNFFVQNMILQAHLKLDYLHGQFGPSANQWAGTDRTGYFGGESMDNWSAAFSGTPQPGYVIAHPMSTGSGHCGIIDYNGWPISAGHDVIRKYNFTGSEDWYDGTCRYRTYTGQ